MILNLYGKHIFLLTFSFYSHLLLLTFRNWSVRAENIALDILGYCKHIICFKCG